LAEEPEYGEASNQININMWKIPKIMNFLFQQSEVGIGRRRRREGEKIARRKKVA